MTETEFRLFTNEAKAIEHIEDLRWGDNPTCPRCGYPEIIKSLGSNGGRSRFYTWWCNSCRYRFTVRIGTFMEDSRIPMRHWCYAFWAAANNPKGLSALHLARVTGLNYRSALYALERIRFAMAPEETQFGMDLATLQPKDWDVRCGM